MLTFESDGIYGAASEFELLTDYILFSKSVVMSFSGFTATFSLELAVECLLI